MRVVFAGTPDFAVPSLQALLSVSARDQGVEVIGVYTQPDRPAGRGKQLHQSPVKTYTLQHQITVYQPENFRSPDAVETLAALQPDLIVVTAYGLLLPQNVLDIPGLGCINVHASLLPRWRGAAPIQRAIQAGDEITGVTLMQMEAGLDTGPMLAQQTISIEDTDTGGSLHDRLAELGGQLLGVNLKAIAAQSLSPQPQQESAAIYAHKLYKSESEIDWTQPAEKIARTVRAFNPWPGTATVHNGQKIRIVQVETTETVASSMSVGQVTASGKTGLDVQTGDGCLRILTLQKSGGRAMSAADFLNGIAMPVGTELG